MAAAGGGVTRELNPLKALRRRREVRRINAVCGGWSSERHWRFFEQVLQETGAKSVCVLGVYQGRDVAYLASILRDLGRADGRLTGVDLFSDAPCRDWAEDQKGKTWEEAGFGTAPNRERALGNLRRLGLESSVTLIQSEGTTFLRNTADRFDFIYVDTSHDYDTTVEHILAAVDRLTPNGWIGGDDFSDEGTWGVKSAVADCFTSWTEHKPKLWLARRAAFARRPAPATS